MLVKILGVKAPGAESQAVIGRLPGGVPNEPSPQKWLNRVSGQVPLEHFWSSRGLGDLT